MTQAANTYAQALYDLAKDEGMGKLLLEELAVLKKVFVETPQYSKLLSTPDIPKQERCGILDEAFRGKVHPYVLNFLKILTEKGYPRHFSDCCAAYRNRYNQDHDILPVRAVTAVALTESQSARLCEKLQTITGKTIELTNRVEPGVLGGVRLDYDGKQLDDTVSHRLENIRNLLNTTVL